MSLSSHQNVTCSRYDTAEKELHRAKGDMTITSILLFQVLNMQNSEYGMLLDPFSK